MGESPNTGRPWGEEMKSTEARYQFHGNTYHDENGMPRDPAEYWGAVKTRAEWEREECTDLAIMSNGRRSPSEVFQGFLDRGAFVVYDPKQWGRVGV
jgi:hypothetical protein